MSTVSAGDIILSHFSRRVWLYSPVWIEKEIYFFLGQTTTIIMMRVSERACVRACMHGRETGQIENQTLVWIKPFIEDAFQRFQWTTSVFTAAYYLQACFTSFCLRWLLFMFHNLHLFVLVICIYLFSFALILVFSKCQKCISCHPPQWVLNTSTLVTILTSYIIIISNNKQS